MKLPDIDLSDELVTHPFMQEHALIFDVKPFQRAYAYAKLVVMMGWGFGFLPYSTGGGKTAFSRYFVENLRADYWRLPVYRVVAKQAVQSATRAFPLRLCAAVGYSSPPKSGMDMCELFESRLAEEAGESNYKRAVLAVDEAGHLGKNEMQVLKDSFNAVIERKAGLYGLLLGESPHLERVIEKLKGLELNGLVRRFATIRLPSLDYVDIADIESAGYEVDNKTWPELGGRTVTQDFFPQAFDAGFRLASLAAGIFEVYGERALKGAEVFGLFRLLCGIYRREDRKTLRIGREELEATVTVLREVVGT